MQSKRSKERKYSRRLRKSRRSKLMLRRRIKTLKSLAHEPAMLANTRPEALYNAKELQLKTIKTWRIIASLISYR